MSDFSAPTPMSKVVTDELFDGGHLSDELRLKCQYHFVHAKVKNKEGQGEDVPQEMMDAINRLEEKLMDNGLRPSDVLATTMG